MNGAQNWVELWKTQAGQRQERLAQVLAQKPINPAVAPIRAWYVKRAQTLAQNHKSWTEAYLGHIKAVADILSKASAKTSTSSKSGSLGDAS